MYQKVSLIIFVCIVGGVFLAGCEVFAGHNTPMAMATSENNDTGIANPAAVYCEKQGFRPESRTAENGSQYAVCIFLDGSECDEWAYFRGECGPASQNPTTENKAVEAAKILLAGELNIEISHITVFSLKPTTWPDSCLGLPAQGEVCNSVQTPGFRVTLTAGDSNYTYRTDLTGENIRLETAGIQV